MLKYYHLNDTKLHTAPLKIIPVALCCPECVNRFQVSGSELMVHCVLYHIWTLTKSICTRCDGSIKWRMNGLQKQGAILATIWCFLYDDGWSSPEWNHMHTHTHTETQEDEASKAEMCLKLSPGLAAGQQPISNQTQTLRV